MKWTLWRRRGKCCAYVYNEFPGIPLMAEFIMQDVTGHWYFKSHVIFQFEQLVLSNPWTLTVCVCPISYNSQEFYERLPELKQAIDQIAGGYFSPEDPNMFKDIANTLLHGDRLELTHFSITYCCAMHRELLHGWLSANFAILFLRHKITLSSVQMFQRFLWLRLVFGDMELH